MSIAHNTTTLPLIRNALIFPGQGSQAPLMGKDIAEQYPKCMEYWLKAEEYSSLPLREIYWNECSQERMLATRALQPALTAFALSLLYCYTQHHAKSTSDDGAYLTNKDDIAYLSQVIANSYPHNTIRDITDIDYIKKQYPDAYESYCHYKNTMQYSYHGAAGHSLGEFPALYACGVLSDDDVLYLTANRGVLMENADPDGKGSMLAIVKLPLEDIQAIVTKVREEYGECIFIANYNTPAQYILSGEKRVFARITELTSQYKGRAIIFPIAGAFHSPMMQKAQNEFIPYLENVTWSDASLPFYSNVTASPLMHSNDIKEAMMKQITSPVRFVEILHAMQNNQFSCFTELCAKSICTAFVKATLSDVNYQAISSMNDLSNR